MSLKSFKSNQHDRNILMNFFRHSEEKLQNWCNYGTQDLVRRDRSKCLEWTSELSKKITGSIEPKNDSKCPPNGSHTLKLGLTMSKVINPKNYKVSNESRVHLPEESTIAPIPASWTSFWTTNASNKGGFQLLDLIIPELKSHVIPYKFKSSHWLRANLVKDFFYKWSFHQWEHLNL